MRGTDHGDRLTVGQVEIKVVHTPGIPPGRNAFRRKIILFRAIRFLSTPAAVVICRGGDPIQMYRTLTQRIMKLNDSTIVCPGHNYSDRLWTRSEGRKRPMLI